MLQQPLSGYKFVEDITLAMLLYFRIWSFAEYPSNNYRSNGIPNPVTIFRHAMNDCVIATVLNNIGSVSKRNDFIGDDRKIHQLYIIFITTIFFIFSKMKTRNNWRRNPSTKVYEIPCEYCAANRAQFKHEQKITWYEAILREYT